MEVMASAGRMMGAREQAVGLLNEAKIQADATSKADLLKNVMEIVLHREPSLLAEFVPYLMELQSEPGSPVRKYLAEYVCASFPWFASSFSFVPGHEHVLALLGFCFSCVFRVHKGCKLYCISIVLPLHPELCVFGCRVCFRSLDSYKLDCDFLQKKLYLVCSTLVKQSALHCFSQLQLFASAYEAPFWSLHSVLGFWVISISVCHDSCR